jgi:RNA polymerase sigma-70 factor (ECF subfamily)
MTQTVTNTVSMGTFATLSPFWNPRSAPAEYEQPASKPAAPATGRPENVPMSEAALIQGLADDALMARIVAGDAQAFTELFKRRQGEVYRFALHMTASPQVSEDVTQDVFMTVMKDAARYDSTRAPVAAWLCGIARNFVRRRLERDRALLPLLEDDSGAEPELPAPIDDPLDDLTRAERIEGLRKAILTLPFRYREVVVLCDLQEMSYVDAAEAVGCAVGTVRSRLHRGRALLAAKLTANGLRVDKDERRLTFRHARCLA